MLNKHFKHNIFLSYSATAITMIGSFILMGMINRYAGVTIYGELVMITSVSGIFISLVTTKSSEAVAKFIVQEMATTTKDNFKIIILIGFATDVVSGVFILGLFALLDDFLVLYFINNVELNFEFFMYGFISFLILIRGTIFGYFQACEIFYVIHITQIAEIVFKIVFIFLSLLLGNKITIELIIYSYLLATFIVTICLFVFFLKSFFLELKSSKLIYNSQLVKEYLIFSFKTFLTSLVASMNSNLDIVVLGLLTNSYSVGVYQVLKNLLAPIIFVSTPFPLVGYTKLLTYANLKQKNLFKKFINNSTYFILSLDCIIGFIMFFVLKIILEFFNIYENYSFEYMLLIIATLIKHSIWWSNIVYNLYNPIKMINMYFTYFIVFLFMTITFYILTKEFYIGYIIIAHTISNIAMLLNSHYYLRKYFQIFEEG